MNKNVCILEIIGLIILIIIPPALRIFVPKEKENEEEEVKLVIKALNCDGKDFITRTSYENDKVKMIVMKKNATSTTETNPSENTNTGEENTQDNSDENQTPEEGDTNTDNSTDNSNTEGSTTTPGEENTTNPEEKDPNANDQNGFEAVFTRLSEDSRVARNDLNDGVVLTLDFSITSASDLNVGDLVKPINDQKIYYEDLGLICSIIE